MGWTDWGREVERSRDVLERILALLLAFAGLADRASGLPAFRRLLLLAILERGEAEARAFITGTAIDPDEAGDMAYPQADHGERLAASFRALALVLGAMLATRGQFTCFACSRFRPRRACRREISKLSRHFRRHAARGPPLSQGEVKSRAAFRPRERGGFRSSREPLFTCSGGAIPCDFQCPPLTARAYALATFSPGLAFGQSEDRLHEAG